MRPKHRIYLFFIAMALLYWNPLSFYMEYGGSVIYSFTSVHVLFWIVFLTGLMAAFLFTKNKVGRKWANFFFSFAITGSLFSLVILADVMVGLAAPVKTSGGLLFEPGSVAHFQTAEFTCTVVINSSGLRDREIDPAKGTQYRILCVGDSWTFGWGVNAENSWPKKLEQYLQQQGIKNIEVINAGRPGMSTIDYRKYLNEMASVLKPDLVLLGVLQLSDLAQLYEGYITTQKKEGLWKKAGVEIKAFLSFSIKHILALTRKKPGSINIRETWRDASGSIIAKLSPGQVARYNMIEDSVRNMFRNGDINPSVLYYYINFPDQVSTFNDPGRPETEFAVDKMNEDIAAIKGICSANNCRLLFLNLPVHSFAGHKQAGMPDDSMVPWFETHNHIDSLYRSIASKNNIPYFELTNGFRNTADSTWLFYRYDGHPNEKGYERIAVLTGQYLVGNNVIPEK